MSSFASSSIEFTDLKPFYTDNCTFWSEGTRDEPELWKDCCIEHDLRYWVGGLKTEQKISDKRLRQCITDVAGSGHGNLMYTFVRLGHLSPIKSKTSWSWGHESASRGEFRVLSVEEKESARNILMGVNIDKKLVDKFIEEHL